MAKRYIAGTGQLLLALIGAALGISWFIALMVQMVAQINGTGAPKSIAWIGETGAAVFAAAWIWALFTSLSILREARDDAPPVIPPS